MTPSNRIGIVPMRRRCEFISWMSVEEFISARSHMHKLLERVLLINTMKIGQFKFLSNSSQPELAITFSELFLREFTCSGQTKILPICLARMVTEGTCFQEYCVAGKFQSWQVCWRLRFLFCLARLLGASPVILGAGQMQS